MDDPPKEPRRGARIMGAPRLKQSEIKEYREKLIAKQKDICPVCKTELRPEDSALDHCHKTGHVRAALHRSCNGAEGRILQWAGARSRGDDPVEFLQNLIRYWKRDWSKNPIHPKHGVPKRRKKRRRK